MLLNINRDATEHNVLAAVQLRIRFGITIEQLCRDGIFYHTSLNPITHEFVQSKHEGW